MASASEGKADFTCYMLTHVNISGIVKTMVSKGRHPNKVIADTLARLDAATFSIEQIHKAHRWGRVVCRGCGQDVPIFSTPRVPEDNAELIVRFARNHADHRPTTDTEEES